jgi:YegS/Rv2252/BmrU family lipid kinase
MDAAATRPAPALHSEAPFRRALVVANPIAGRGLGAKAALEMAVGLQRLGVPSETHLTTGRGDGRAAVRCMDPAIDLVVSIGGDGTLREVFDGLLQPEVAVCMVPLGTAIVLSLDLGLPRDVDRALEVIAGGRTATIDLGLSNGHVSFLVTGVGLDGLTVREVERTRSGPLTKWSYVRGAWRALQGYRPPQLEVEIDGERERGRFGLVLSSNVVNYGGFMRLSADRRLDDGLFEVYLFERGRRRDLAATALRGIVSRLPGGTVRMKRARRVRVDAPEPVAVQVDGDYRGETPLEFEVSSRQVRILVP